LALKHHSKKRRACVVDNFCNGDRAARDFSNIIRSILHVRRKLDASLKSWNLGGAGDALPGEEDLGLGLGTGAPGQSERYNAEQRRLPHFGESDDDVCEEKRGPDHGLSSWEGTTSA
jgi:hypothetical protein